MIMKTTKKMIKCIQGKLEFSFPSKIPRLKLFEFFSDNLLHESGPVSLPASRLTKKEPSPPPPPPRGSNSYTRSHARSSSLDLNNIQGVHPRPPLPPRIDPSAPTTRLTRDCRALQCKIQEYREKNSVVARTNNELHQEVSDALEERIALEYQLEQLKSFGDE